MALTQSPFLWTRVTVLVLEATNIPGGHVDYPDLSTYCTYSER